MTGENQPNHQKIHRKRKIRRNRVLDLLAFCLLLIFGSMFFLPIKEYISGKMLDYVYLEEGVLEDKISTHGVMIYDSKVVQASGAGQWQAVVQEGERVADGELVGYLVSGSSKKPVYANSPGAVSYQIDGLEAVLTPAHADSIDLDKILALLEPVPENKKANAKDNSAAQENGSIAQEEILGTGKGLFKIIDNLSDVYFFVRVDDANRSLSLEPESQVTIVLPALAGQKQEDGQNIAGQTDSARKQKATVVSVLQSPNGTQVLLKIKRNDIVLSGERKVAIELVLDSIKGGIVPKKAIFYDEAGKPWVFVVKKSRVAKVEVEVVGTVGDMAAISGITAGTPVITNPSLAKENQKVYF